MAAREGYIIYIDMDSFFASCELLRHPDLKEKPFAVVTKSADKFRGVVQTANYSARKFGIHSFDWPKSHRYRHTSFCII